MTQSTENSIASTLDTEEKLLPYMPWLLQDLWALGCSLNQIIEVAGSLDLPPNSTTVLDLGCGKGAVSINLAKTHGFKTTGIDAMEPFLETARQKAKENNMENLCSFEKNDILKFTSTAHDFDIVILAAVDGVFSSFTAPVARLRTQIKPGGYMIIDDGFLKHGERNEREGYEHHRSLVNTIRELTAYNDIIIDEINTSTSMKKMNDKNMHLITTRAEELILEHPELKKDIESYIQRQKEECQFQYNEFEGAMWLIKRN